MARKKASTAEWDVQDAPPTEVKTVRNAGRQFGATAKPVAKRTVKKSVAPAKRAAKSVAAPVQAKTKKSEAAEKRAAREEEATRQTEKAVTRRTGWEASSEGKTRQSDIRDFATAHHNKMIREHPEFGMKPVRRLKMSHGQLYRAYGFGEHEIGPTMHDRQLPGLEDPDALPRPKQWEDHTPAERTDIEKRVKKESGATPQSMERSFGAQLDQGYIRAHTVGASEPYAQTFYTHGEAAQRLKQSARTHDIGLGKVAAINADTSPNMKFKFQYKSGEVRYPNAELADHIIDHIKAGKHPDDYTKEGLTGHARSGYPANVAKGLKRAHQMIREGRGVSETHMGTGTGSGFGPKTGVYHNAWLTGTPQFLVSDLHTGGGGMVPHLGSEKPYERDERGEIKLDSKGKPRRAKSEREETIEVPGFHALSDYAARKAMRKRGLGRIPQAQATQWGEETIHRHEQATAQGEQQVASQFPSQEKAYPPIAHPVQFRRKGEGQGRLF